MSSPNLVWEGDKALTIGDVRFFVTWDAAELSDVQSSNNAFLLGKGRPGVERFVALGQQQSISKVFEMGIFKGGSVVLYDKIFQPDRIVAIDYSSNPVAALANYIDSRNKSNVIKPFYGINQADRSAMERILVAEFPERDIDLVIDDASHFYKETREAFNITFPYLKPGGLYVIEDWGWAHWPGEFWQTRPWQLWKPRPFRGTKALSNLLIELAMLAASRSDLVENIFVNHNVIFVRKGQGQFPKGRFNIRDHYLMRGKAFKARL